MTASRLHKLRDGARKLGDTVSSAAAAAAKLCAQEARSTAQEILSRGFGTEEEDELISCADRGYALITGASSGIGLEFARQLSLDGYPLILVARRRDRLETLRAELGTECLLIPADLQRREDLIRLCEDLVGRRIEVFINNAGFGVAGPFMGTDISREVGMIDVNVTAQHILLKYVLHRMESEGGGYILNVASSAGLLPGGPYMAGYYATKAYMVSLTRAVAEELRRSGSPVYVGCLCPGPVDTEFNDVADVAFTLPGITPEYCVDYAVRMMEKGKTVIIPDRGVRLALLGSRLLPDALAVRIAATQQKKRTPEPPESDAAKTPGPETA